MIKLGDKETVAICIQASVTCYLHVIHRYTHMVRTICVWSYRMRMVYKIVPYAYGTYHTRMPVCTIHVWYKIRLWYRTPSPVTEIFMLFQLPSHEPFCQRRIIGMV